MVIEVQTCALPIKKIRERFGVERARPAAYYKRMGTIAVLRKKRYAGKIEHIEDIRITQLILESKTDYIEFIERAFRLEGEERYALLPHDLFHVVPRRERALARDISSVV